jgi:DNA-binding GntR family transcriptional regulator
MVMNAQRVAYNHLKHLIMSGELPANAPISAEVVGRALGISRMPVREALLQLQAEGLVTFGANRRPFVTARTQKEIVELFEIRVALESLAIERAAPRITPAILDQLGRQLDRMEKATSDPKRWLARHDEFHDIIYAASDMPRLMDEIRRTRYSIQPYIFMYINAYKIPEMPGAEHATIVDVLARRDPSLVRSALAQHIRDAASGVIYFLMSGQGPAPAIAASRQRFVSKEKVL